MIINHEDVRSYVTHVLDAAGAPDDIRDKVNLKVQGDRKGNVTFPSNHDRPDNCDWNMLQVSVPYTLPAEPERLKYLVLRGYFPESVHWLANGKASNDRN